MKGILNGDYDFLVNHLTHIKQAGYPTDEYNRLNLLKKRKNWFNQQKQKSNDSNWRPSRQGAPSPAVSTRSVDEISFLTDDTRSMKRTVDHQKITIAKLTARLWQSDDDISLFSTEVSVDPPALTNSTNPAHVRQKRCKATGKACR